MFTFLTKFTSESNLTLLYFRCNFCPSLLVDGGQLKTPTWNPSALQKLPCLFLSLFLFTCWLWQSAHNIPKKQCQFQNIQVPNFFFWNYARLLIHIFSGKMVIQSLTKNSCSPLWIQERSKPRQTDIPLALDRKRKKQNRRNQEACLKIIIHPSHFHTFEGISGKYVPPGIPREL